MPPCEVRRAFWGLASGLALALRPGQCAAFRLVAVTFRPALGALAVSAAGRPERSLAPVGQSPRACQPGSGW